MFVLRPPNSVRRGPFFERKNVCNSQENGVRTRCTAVVNHPAILKILRVVNLVREVFLVRRGPLGFLAEKKKTTTKNGGHRGKISVVDMAFLVFIGFFYPPLAWKVSLCGQKSAPNDFLSVVVVYVLSSLRTSPHHASQRGSAKAASREVSETCFLS